MYKKSIELFKQKEIHQSNLRLMQSIKPCEGNKENTMLTC